MVIAKLNIFGFRKHKHIIARLPDVFPLNEIIRYTHTWSNAFNKPFKNKSSLSKAKSIGR